MVYPSIFRLVLLALLALPAGCAAPPDTLPLPAPAAGPAGEAVTIAVVERGWHTDLGVPAERLRGPLAELASPEVRFLVFGFGDRAFYMAREETVGGMLAALFPGPGVMLVTALKATPEEAFGPAHVVRLAVPPQGFGSLQAFLWQSFAHADGGRAVPLGDGPYPGSRFFASDTTYDALHDCNAWTAEGLAAAGLAIDPAGVLFAGQVMDQTRRAAGQQGGEGPAVRPSAAGPQ